MFQGVRNGSLIYILYKDEPTIKMGQVVSVGNPRNKYQQQQQMLPFNLNTADMVIDITIKVDGENKNLEGLPAVASVADFGKVVFSDTKEAIMSELDNMLKTSKEVIASVDYHKSMIEKIEILFQSLNPQIAKDKEIETKIISLEDKISRVDTSIEDIRLLLQRLATSQSKTKKDENNKD